MALKMAFQLAVTGVWSAALPENQVATAARTTSGDLATAETSAKCEYGKLVLNIYVKNGFNKCFIFILLGLLSKFVIKIVLQTWLNSVVLGKNGITLVLNSFIWLFY